MANTNFIVQNGLTVGPLTIDAATGSITTTGNLQVAGFQANTTQDSLTAGTVTVTQVAGLKIAGVQAATVSDAQAFAIALS
jgi:hypothetical protein